MLPLGRPLQAHIETAADVIPQVRHPTLAGTVLYDAALDMDGSAHRALLPLPRQTYFYPLQLMLQSKTLAEVSYVEERRTLATK